MPGQHRDISNDKSHSVTIGSTDDPKYAPDTYFVTQINTDSKGNETAHQTTVFNSNDEVIAVSEK